MKIKILLFFLLLAATFANTQSPHGTCQHNTRISGSDSWWSCNWDRAYTCGGGGFCCCETGFAPDQDGYCVDCGDHSGWVNTQYTRHNHRHCDVSSAEVDMTPSEAEDYCDARGDCGGYQFSYYWHDGRRPQFFGKDTAVSDCSSNRQWTVWSKPRQCLIRMVGKRYIGGTPLLKGTYVARTDNDDGEDCERQCKQNARCNAWEFGSWHNKFHCANWEKTASGFWADEANRVAAGECNTSIFVEGPTTGCESGYTQPQTAGKCQAIARAANIPYVWLFHREYPHGCLYSTSERTIYFNHQSTGSTNRGDIRSVCVDYEACSTCRIRRNWNRMDEQDKKTYIDTVNIARRDEPYKSQYDALVISHGKLPFDEIHGEEQFFAWHRWFILEYENILRQITPCITVPYWAWEVAGDNWHQDELWGPEDHQFGSCGHGPVNGPFSDMILPGTNIPLKRQCRVGSSLPKISDLDFLFDPSNNFATFFHELDYVHGWVHWNIGGSMRDPAYSGMAPEFFLHHNNVDRLWTNWQLKSKNHELAQPSRNGILTGTSPTYTVDDFTRARNQAGTCVEYEDHLVHISGRRRLGEKITKVNLAVAISNQLPKDVAFRNLLVHTNELSLQISEDFEAGQLIFAANQRGDSLSDERAHEIAHLHQENSNWSKYIKERKVDTKYVPDSEAKAFFTDIVGITSESVRHALETTHKIEDLQTFDRQWAEFEQLFSEK